MAPGRLRRRAEFLAVAKHGRRVSMPGFLLQAMHRGDQAPVRLGFTVTKRVGNAVVRNRTKRRLRALARLGLAERSVVGMDLVLIGREATRSLPFAVLRANFERALARVLA